MTRPRRAVRPVRPRPTGRVPAMTPDRRSPPYGEADDRPTVSADRPGRPRSRGRPGPAPASATASSTPSGNASATRTTSAPGAPEPPRHDRRRLGALLLGALVLVAGAIGVQQFVLDDRRRRRGPATGAAPPDSAGAARPRRPPPPRPPPGRRPASPRPGCSTFRGNPTRSYYGEGPVPTAARGAVELPGERRHVRRVDRGQRDPHVVRHGLDRPARGVRARRPHLGGVRRLRPQPSTSSTPTPARTSSPPFQTGDIIKGSVTIDPDGYPLVYTGSRDN